MDTATFTIPWMPVEYCIIVITTLMIAFLAGMLVMHEIEKEFRR